MTAHHIQPFVSGSFRLAQRFLVFCLFVFRFQHVVAHVSPYFYSYEISIIWIHLPIHQLINIRMGSTFWLANNLTNICVRALVWPRFQFPQEYALQWNWLGNVFQSGVQHFTSSSAVWGFQYLHILTKHLLFSHFLTVVILMVVGWYPTVVLIFISIICDLVNHFMCLLATCISSLQKCLFKFFAHFWIRLFVLHCWVLNFFYIFCILNWYQIYDFQIFSHSMSHLFNYVVSVFSCPNF